MFCQFWRLRNGPQIFGSFRTTVSRFSNTRQPARLARSQAQAADVTSSVREFEVANRHWADAELPVLAMFPIAYWRTLAILPSRQNRYFISCIFTMLIWHLILILKCKLNFFWFNTIIFNQHLCLFSLKLILEEWCLHVEADGVGCIVRVLTRSLGIRLRVQVKHFFLRYMLCDFGAVGFAHHPTSH